MPDQIEIFVSPLVFARLQQLAVPLVDNTDSVINKLIDHWESSPLVSLAKPPSNPSPAPGSLAWRSKQGDVLLVGTPLRARYCGRTFGATVEKHGIRFDDHLYESLSAAGCAAKKQLGRSDEAAQTNGRTFWELQDPVSEKWVTVKALRPEPPVDVDALFAELMKS